MANRSDDFDRDNGQDLDDRPNPSDGGSAWVRLTGQGMYLDNGALRPWINKRNAAVLESSAADGEVALVWTSRASNILAVFRATDVDNYLYVLFSVATARAQLYKREGGSETQIGSNLSLSVSAGDTVSVVFSGNTIDVEVNGTSQNPGWSSSFQSSATKHGLGFDGSAADRIGSCTFTESTSASMSSDRSAVLTGSSGTVTLNLTGTGTSWDGTTVFTPSGVSGWTKDSQSVTSATTASITLNRSTSTGTLTITESVTGSAETTVNVVSAATVAATGDWSAESTWDIGDIPGNGHTITVPNGYTLTCDSNRTIGTSPSNTSTNAITLSGTGSLTVASGATLTVRGNVVVDNGVLQVGTDSGGGTLEFDSSQAGTPTTEYQCVIGGSGKTASRFRTRGTSGSHSVVRSNSGGGNANVVITDGLYDCQWCDFLRIGSASTESLAIHLIAPPSAAHAFSDCTFTSCGRLRTVSTLSSIVGLLLERVRFTSSLHSTESVRLIGIAPDIGVTRVVNLCSFDKGLVWTEGSFSITSSVLDGDGGGASNAGSWPDGFFDGNFVRITTAVGFAVRGTCRDCVFVSDGFDDNPHTVLPRNTGSQHEIDGCWLDFTGDIITDHGNIFYGNGDWIVRNCICPRAVGVTAGAAAVGAITFAEPSCRVIHCTLYSPQYSGGILIGDGGTTTDEYPEVKSNIFWVEPDVTNGRAATALSGSGQTVENPITPSGCTHNGHLNIQTPKYQGNYPTTQPGANDVSLDATDPATVFVDPTRNIATWAVSRGSTSTTYADRIADARAYLRADPTLIPDLLAHVRAGFAVKYTPWRTAAHDGTVVGAVQDEPPSPPSAAAGFFRRVVVGRRR
jgi:hypothetical protein